MQNADKKTRVDDAYTRIKDEIRTNRMPPGYQAPEPEIALRLGMSRTPVREALIRLSSEGLVELIPRRGARILPIHAEDMREVYEILAALEPDAAAALASRKLSDDDLEPLMQTTRDMEKALDTGDLDAWAEADDRFHRGILHLHGNRRLRDFVEALFDQVHRARMVTLRLRKTPRESTREHREILNALKAGDAETAARVFRDHRKRAAREILAILEDYKLAQL